MQLTRQLQTSIMAEADRNPKAQHTAFLDDAAKQVLLERYLDLVFVVDVTDLSCKRCGRVVIHHHVANCGHLFCRNCQRILSFGEKWKSQCPECKERQDAEVERRVHELRLHCPNHKYGCKVIDSLQHIPEHLRKCGETREANLPALYDEIKPNANTLVRILEMSKCLNELTEQFDRILKLSATDDSRRQQINNRLDDMESIVKGSSLMVAKLQVEVSNNSSRLTGMERDSERQSHELSIRLSKVEMQQSKIDDSYKEKCEVFDGNRGDHSQTQIDAMEQSIKSQAQDFSGQMNS